MKSITSAWLQPFLLTTVIIAMVCGVTTGCSDEKDWKLMTPTGETQAEIKQYPSAPKMIIDYSDKSYQAIILTNRGDITVSLFNDDTWITVNNFVFLSLERFYDGCPIHRTVKGSFIQTGDPTGTGTGNAGYSFNDETFNTDYIEGAVAMANRGPDTNGSQFFICDDALPDLPKNYTIFGRVTKGIDVVHELAAIPVVTNPLTGELSSPTVDIHIETIEIYEAD